MPQRQDNSQMQTRQSRENYLSSLQAPAETVGGTPEQERQARAAGYRNYDQMRVYMMQRQNRTGGSVRDNGEIMGQDSGSSRGNAMSWHPAQLLSYVQRKWNEAMGD